jgi:hypothetical protein
LNYKKTKERRKGRPIEKKKSKIKTLINLKRRDGRGAGVQERNLGSSGSKKKVERKRVGKEE